MLNICLLDYGFGYSPFYCCFIYGYLYLKGDLCEVLIPPYVEILECDF
nr:MAG TPA: hypothetical protein [Caudoviricetes sp.]